MNLRRITAAVAGMLINRCGTFWRSRAVYPHLRKNTGSPRGVVINLSSVAGKQAWSGGGTYSTSKFGVLALTQALADERKGATLLLRRLFGGMGRKFQRLAALAR